MQEPQLTYRMGWIVGGILVGFAALADLLQILLTLTIVFAPVADIITIIVEGVIFCTFLIQGLPFLRGKRAFSRMAVLFGETVIEMVPFLSGLPTLTLGTLYQIHAYRKEDQEEFKERHAQWEAETRRQQDTEQAAYAFAARQARMRQLEALGNAEQVRAEEEEYA